ncbi:amino acid ABC transporter substrate-binding protein [Aeromicrobium sp. YIM 150415]|uniref:ABC transporter substrate-binding protein n=1 Tax=Aeromicrobium sp. YIM 150415 TaxID=2803912 RepID=UPI001964513D|nr:ABC transporter substrate-binding protein [Aeromicrobium sp. YIM 150415]MBM9465198.1 amino acid ABC transporter substrate-binding protein [Aeromicrobium sp. YIM 150415]
MRSPRILGLSAAAGVLVLASACSPADDNDNDSASATPGEGECSVDSLPVKNDGTLTIATDDPAFEPWFADNDPSNGEGYESAVAYAVAEELGFAAEDVEWIVVPFNSSYQPGAKDFDFDINQISISEDREQAVDFSEPYYSAAQAILTLEDSDFAGATSLEEFADARLGAQIGTTSLTAIDQIDPSTDPLVYDDTVKAAQALENGQVDAIVADLPSAFYLTAAEIEGSTIAGQFQPETGDSEEFGLLMEKDSELKPCLDAAVSELKDNGTLDDIETQWLSESADVPELQ